MIASDSRTPGSDSILSEERYAVKRRRTSARRAAQQLQRIRARVSRKMEKEVSSYFEDLAEQIVERARRASKQFPSEAGMVIAKALPTVEDLILPTDDDALNTIFREFALSVCAESWDTWNSSLGVDLVFGESDPAVVEALGQSGSRIRQISETTRQAVRDLLQYGAEHGWSIDDLVAGDDTQPGLFDTVQQTYRGRARTIARTELGTAQNVASFGRYENFGVKRVMVFDGGSDDSDDVCNLLDGTDQSIEWARAHPLQHPNCVRAFGPFFPD